MDEKHYELRILPLFEEKLQEIVDYIAYRLRNPIAAEAFLDAVKESIHERMKAPEAFVPYRSKKGREHIYYAIPVKNYFVFCVVIGNVMEVRTLVYARRDLPRIV
ncbi:MAG: type II toxin-antitoxin system RelE/ParE family toxin [Oscillospiraceae bacterium]|nr:type II toxin-antitoxin system RelE/ParE family toxin [Oscillospiraceae bacterium]